MTIGLSRTYVRELSTLYDLGAVGALNDPELLARFMAGDREMAQRSFEALVDRHGPMVMGICRRLLRDRHLAEDAFQATFVVLALKAHTIRKHDSLGAWLFGVAARVARRAKSLSSRPEAQSLTQGGLTVCAPERSEIDADLRSALDEEIDRLPDAYRRAVVLCYVEGATQEVAARELGWTKGTVSGRLARAKDLLRARLTRRGFAPSVALLRMALSEPLSPATVPAPLVDAAVRAALAALLGRGEVLAGPGIVMALARSTLRTMVLGKMTLTLATFVMLAALATALAQTGSGLVLPRQNQNGGPRGEAALQPSMPPIAAVRRLPQHAVAQLGTTRLRHESLVSGVAFAPDGHTLASSSWDRTVKFWDTATGEPSAKFPTLQGHDGALSLAYSPDGTKLVIGHNAGWVRLWDLTRGRELLRIKPHNGDVQSVAFAPDGRLFATSADNDRFVRIWGAHTGREQPALAFSVEQAFRGQLAFSLDGKRLALGATPSPLKDGESIFIWDLKKGGEPIVIRRAHDGYPASLLFTPDGSLISCGTALRRVQVRKNVIGLESSPQIRIWDSATGRMVRELETGVNLGKCKAALSRDGKILVSSHFDRMLVWDLASWKITRRIDIPVDERNFGGSGGIAMSHDGTMVAAERHDHVVHLWDLATGKPRFPEIAAHDTTLTATMSADGRLAATGDDRGNVCIWDPTRGTLQRRLELGGSGRIWSLRFAAPDGRSLAAAGECLDRLKGISGIIRIWDIPGFSVRHHLTQEQRAVAVEFSPDGRRAAVASWNGGYWEGGPVDAAQGTHDNTIDLIDAATGKKLLGLSGHEGRIQAIAFSSDGMTLVSAAASDSVRFWDLAAGRKIREISIDGNGHDARDGRSGPRTSHEAATISSDLKTAVTTDMFGAQVLVWNLQAGRVQSTFALERYLKGAVAMSPDGRLLAAAATPFSVKAERAARIRIWDVATQRELMCLEPGVSEVRSLAFSADGKSLISGMSDTTALVWDVSEAFERSK